jgi:hypothetical protein
MELYKGLRVVNGVIVCECCETKPVAVVAHLSDSVTFHLCVECDGYSRGIDLVRRCTDFICPCG